MTRGDYKVVNSCSERDSYDSRRQSRFSVTFSGGQERNGSAAGPNLRDVSEQGVDSFLSQVGGCSRERVKCLNDLRGKVVVLTQSMRISRT